MTTQTLAAAVDMALETAQVVNNILRDDTLTSKEKQELIEAIMISPVEA